jgi:hypothetical protein
MDPGLPDPLHFSLPDALIVEMEMIDMSTIQLTKPNERRTRWSLYLGITIWFLHLNALNALTSVSCKWGWLTFPVGGLSGLQFAQLVISLIALLTMLFLIYLPWREWQMFQSEKSTRNPRLLQDTEEDNRPLIAFIAMSMNSFLLLFMIATFVPIFALKACGHA